MKLSIPSELTKEERDRILKETIDKLNADKRERAAAATAATEALKRLVDVMKQRTDQSRVLRSLLYSLWADMPCASLCDVLCLDWPLRKDLGAVLLGFGFESKSHSFFYDDMKAAITSAGLWDWFLEAAKTTTP